jgi:hypothetical protein
MQKTSMNVKTDIYYGNGVWNKDGGVAGQGYLLDVLEIYYQLREAGQLDGLY